jgi:phenylacetic acid degradation operon negative regulatory protein
MAAARPAPRVSARSLVLDLLSTLRRGAMPVRALVEAAALFGIAPGSVRVALSRLLAEGRIERDLRGSYRLGRAAVAVHERVASWRRLEERVRPWREGEWLAVVARRPAPAGAGRVRRRHARALRMLGFRPLERGLEVRPDNLAGGIARVREDLARLGLAPGALVCELRGLDALTEARARALWNARDLVAGYRRHRRAIAASARRLPGRPEPEAMTESFERGGAVLRLLAFDPLLPEPIVPAGERAALVEAMRRYDDLGRAAWRGFLAEFGVLPRSAALDTRAIAGRGST